MIRLYLAEFLSIVDRYLKGSIAFSEVKRYVYQYYENDIDLKLDGSLEKLFPAFAPYLEYEEAFGDKERYKRIRRLRAILRDVPNLKERVIFALEFEEACGLKRAFQAGKMEKNTYQKKIRRLSPIEYDIWMIDRWAKAHLDREDICPDLMD